MDTLLRDLRHALKQFVRQPGFVAATVLALTLGIGATSAIFTIVNAILLRPLPYEEPERLVATFGNFSRLDKTEIEASASEYLDYTKQSTSFEGIAAHMNYTFNLCGAKRPERFAGAAVSANLFSVLRVKPIMGRTFTLEEDQYGRDNVVIMSYSLWMSRFDSDPEIIGKSIPLNCKNYSIIGVMPPGFNFPPDIDLWKPLGFGPEQMAPYARGWRFLNLISRLKPGVSLREAQGEFDVIGNRLQEMYPDKYPSDSGWRITIVPMLDHLVAGIRPALIMLFGAVGFALLIACANVANLLLARAAALEKEIAVRVALGASRARLIRQSLTESAVLSLTGGVLGLVLAYWGLKVLVGISPEESIPRVAEIHIEWRVLLFTLIVSLGTGIVFGLAPALQSSKPNLNEVLKESGRSSTESVRKRRTKQVLVVAEVALALVLLVGAGLMVRSFLRVLKVDPGFDSNNVMTIQVALSKYKYPGVAGKRSFYQSAMKKIEALPGVQAVGATTSLPMTKAKVDWSFTIEGIATRPDDFSMSADLCVISPGYFEVMGIPTAAGRPLDERDGDGAPKVMMINETMARRFWPGEDPIGRRLKLGGPDSDKPWMTIVGIARDVRHRGLDGDVRQEMYTPYLQGPAAVMTLAVKSANDPASLVAAVREAVVAVDPDQPVHNIKLMTQYMTESIAQRKFNLVVMATFAVVALVLAGIGIYGLMSYSVTQQTQEIGIMMALGARQSDVVKMVVRQGLILAGTGVAIGIAGALVLTRVMASLLYGVSATDPITFLGVPGLLIVIVILACYLPARRAAKVDPIIAMRCA